MSENVATDASAILDESTIAPIGLRRPALHYSERRLLLVAGDLLALNVALAATVALRRDIDPAASGWTTWLVWILVLSGLWTTVGSIVGVYDLGYASSAFRSSLTTALVALSTGLVYLFIPLVTPDWPERRIYMLIFPALAAIGVSAWRLLFAKVLGHAAFRRRALIIGAGRSGRYLAATLRELGPDEGSMAKLGYELIGCIDAGHSYAGALPALPVLGGIDDLATVVGRQRPHDLVVALDPGWQPSDALLQALIAAQESGVRITTMTRVYEQLTGRIALDYAGQRFDIVLPLSVGAGHRMYLALRRILEVAISLPGCALVALIAPFLLVANRFSSPGPLFFSQERIGRGGKPFQIVKFRSMVVDAERHTGAVWASANDPRVTAIGRFLRKTRIDELPQFWNILVGDMALIGPRPERQHFIDQLSQSLPFYRVRHSVRPGLTGWAQVKYRYADSSEDYLVKLQYDLYYVKHHRPYLDILILLKTAQIVFGLKGR